LALIPFVPLLWLLTVTSTAAVQKIWHSDPRIGFLAKARQIEVEQLPKQEEALKAAYAVAAGKAIESAEVKNLDRVLAATLSLRSQRTNQYLDAFVTGCFLALVAGIFLLSVREWVLLVARKKAAEPRETPPVWLPDYAVAEAKPFQLFSFLALSLALLRELSGEAAVDRAQQHPAACRGMRQVALLEGGLKPPTRAEAYAVAVEHRFRGPTRCC
jgi:carbon starvation protein